METDKRAFLALILTSLVWAKVTSENGISGCEESEKFKEHYFRFLENNQDFNGNNDKVFLEIHFKYPSFIQGWNVKGRRGTNQGPIRDRAGLILKYAVKYGSREGSWIPVESPKTRRDVFVNRGNLAFSDKQTKVVLKQPIKTKVLRFFPEMWDGAPYMAVRVRYCIDDNDFTNWHKMERKGLKLPKESSKETMETYTSGPINSEPEERTSQQVKQPTVLDECKSSVIWRYDGKRELRDVFTASTKGSPAEKAAYSKQEDPYLFSSNKPKREYIQIKLAASSRIYSMRIVGKSDDDDWGVINQFSLFYQDSGGKWKYYTDSNGNRRIFDTKVRNKASVLLPEEFKLPIPLDARILRIYPHEWSGKPYLSLDLKACYLDDPIPKFEKCSNSLLSKDGTLVAISFDQLKKNDKLMNYRTYKTLDLNAVDNVVLVTAVNVRLINTEAKISDVVKSFAMQYLNTDMEWKNIVDDDGIIKVFDIHSKTSNVPKIFKLPDPVETSYLRLYPESWTGKSPTVFLDVLGCSN